MLDLIEEFIAQGMLDEDTAPKKRKPRKAAMKQKRGGRASAGSESESDGDVE